MDRPVPTSWRFEWQESANGWLLTHITPLPNGRVRVDFQAPQRAISPGQAVVLYDDDEVLGGGTIENPAVTAAGTSASSAA